MAEFQFYSDTNQRIFEDDLDQYGVEYRCVGAFGTKVVVTDPPDWVADNARDLGAECSC
jgi:hypothetical protein